MTILSWNILTPAVADWASRRLTVWRVLRQFAPDFICLQEPMHQQVYETLRQADLGPQYELVGLGRERDDHFPDGAARCREHDPDSPAGGEWTPIFFRTDRFQLIPEDRPTTVWYHPDSGRRNSPGTFWPGASFPRIFTWSRFRDRSTGTETAVYNTHLEHTSAAIRLGQAAQLAEHVRESLRSIPRAIVVGDFNDPPGSGTLAEMTRVIPRICDDRPTWRGFSPSDRPEKIDYIFAAGFDAARFTLLETPRVTPPPGNTDGRVSDHAPLLAELE